MRASGRSPRNMMLSWVTVARVQRVANNVDRRRLRDHSQVPPKAGDDPQNAGGEIPYSDLYRINSVGIAHATARLSACRAPLFRRIADIEEAGKRAARRDQVRNRIAVERCEKRVRRIAQGPP